jgi:hypothetical protein
MDGGLWRISEDRMCQLVDGTVGDIIIQDTCVQLEDNGGHQDTGYVLLAGDQWRRIQDMLPEREKDMSGYRIHAAHLGIVENIRIQDTCCQLRTSVHRIHLAN